MRREELASSAVAYITDAVVGSDFGAGTTEIRERLAPFLALAASRFLGVGAEQYQISETEQSFERASIGTMLVGAIEEVVDLANYAAMLDILIGRELAAIETGDVSNADDGNGTLAVVLEDLRADLRTASAFSASSGVMLNVYIEKLVSLGVYAMPTGDYVSTLDAEVREVDLSREVACINEMRAENGKPPIADLAGTPALELGAARLYIAALEDEVKRASSIEPDVCDTLSEIRDAVGERGDVDADALAEWFSA